MKWNVAATVVDIVEAPTSEAAIGILEKRLQKKGFEVYDDIDYPAGQAFPCEFLGELRWLGRSSSTPSSR
jgi:hypothetical protein